MKIPTKIIDLYDNEEYIYDRKEYNKCYRYKHTWYNTYGNERQFYRYLEPNNILYEEWQKTLEGKESKLYKFIYESKRNNK